MTAHRVDFVDENNAGRGFLALLEHVTDARSADADEHFDEIGTTDREKWNVRLTCNRAGEQSFTGARRTDHQHAFGNAASEFLKLFRIAQEFDELLDFIFRFLDA